MTANDMHGDRGRNILPVGRSLLFVWVLILAPLTVACGVSGADGGSAGSEELDHTHLDVAEATTEVRVVVVPSELVVGPNRFAVGLFDQEDNLIQDATVHFHYYDLRDPDNALLESEATARPVQDREGYTTIFTHDREFTIPGQWGVEVDVYMPNGNKAKQRVGFVVMNDSPSLSAGEQAPGLNTLTAEDVKQDLGRLTSSQAPEPALHQLSLAQALANGKPTVLLFATPAYCETRFCGPAYEEVKKLLPLYGDQLNFVYVEVFSGLPDPASTNWAASPAVTAFGLESEPWVYLIDAGGTIVYRLEGIFTAEEVEEQIRNRLGL